jgi:uncharacterized delta-60 repeat protein
LVISTLRGPGSNYHIPVVVQPDGKIVAATNVVSASTGYEEFALARYNADGTLDSSFGNGGIVTTAVGKRDAYINGLALTSNGAIVAVGSAIYSTAPYTDNAFALARYTSSGSLDARFGTGGITLTNLSLASSSNGGLDEALAVSIQSTGKILVAGHAQVSAFDFALARYNSNGFLDGTFGSGGIVITPNFGGAEDVANALAVQPADGKIVLAGYISSSPSMMAVARYLPGGTIDSSFGTGGIITMAPAGATGSEGLGVLIQNSDIIVSGYSNFSVQTLTLAGLTSAGQPDLTFGGSGTGFALNSNMALAVGVTQAANGDLLMAGTVDPVPNSYDLAVAAYLADGTPDAAFGTGGITSVDVSGGADRGRGIAVQPDGNIVLAGYTYPSGSSSSNLVLGRFLSPVPVITTASLASWTLSQPGYTQTIAATGGTGSISLSIAAGTLPPGFALDSGGVLSGTPTTTGSYAFTVKATDAVGATASQNYNVTINAAPTITTATLSGGTINQPAYNQTFQVSGGTTPFVFTKTGVLPPGLTLSSTGSLYGTPTSAGSYSFTVTATDSASATAQQSYTVIINPAVVIATKSLSNGTVNQPGYNQTIRASGGSGTYTFSQTDGTLPPGLNFSSGGVLSGMAMATGSFSFAVTATDSFGASGTQNLTLKIVTLGIGPATLPSWTVNQPGYSQTFTATGGAAPFTFAATGSSPAGLTLTSAGVLSGTPTAAGSFSFSVSVTDSTLAMVSQNYTVIINPALAISTTSLDNWTTNLAGYSLTLGTSGGTGVKTFATSSGTLPAGLTLNSTGVLSGTPTAPGSSTFVITATDVTGASAGQSYSVTINPPVAITPTMLPLWTASLPGYSQSIGATGGTGSKTFTVTSGVVPTGLVLSAAGVLSGTPTAPASFGFTVTATDTVGATGTQAYTLTINPVVSITTATAASWTIHQAGYNQTFVAAGGTGTKSFAKTSGTLPPGLTLSSSGVLTGTPAAAGSYSVTVTATDGLGASASKSYTIVINPAVAITTTSLPSWTAGFSGYSLAIRASGGTGTVTFTSGTLPAGVTLSSAGVLTVTPASAGSFSFTITATDSVGASASQGYTLTINPAVSVLTATLPSWTAGVSGYLQTISATGGTGSLTFSQTTGALPPGLTLNSSNGKLSGTPTAAGSYTFAIAATDSVGASGSKNYIVIINPTPTITMTALANWTVNQTGYSQTISTSGGTGALTFTQSAGTLPSGLVLSSSGVLSGTPTATGSFSFTVMATDTLAINVSKTFTVIISAPPSHFLVSATASAAANGYLTVTVTALDPSNLVSIGYNGVVHFSSTDTAALLPADSTLTNGIGMFTVTLRTLGSQTVTARDSLTTSITGSTDLINVVSPALVVVDPGFTGPAGTTVSGHVIGFDAFAAIQQAVTVVGSGGTVQVDAGSYHESVAIGKSLNLQGNGSGSAFVMGTGSGAGLTVTGGNVSVSGLTVENFASGLTAARPTASLMLSDLRLTGNTAGGAISGVSAITFAGTSSDETLIATASQFGRQGDNLIGYSGVGHLELDGNGGDTTLDLSGAAGPLGVFLSGKGALSGFAGNTTLPGVTFTNTNDIAGNNVAGDFLVGTGAAATWTLAAGTSQYVSGGQTLSFTGLNTVYGGGTADAFTVNSAGSGGLTVNGQGGGDSFTVSLGALAGPVSLYDVGGGGTNTATINGTSASDSLTVYSTAVTWNNNEDVNYAGLQGLTVNSGSGADAIAVQSDAVGTPTTVSGTGADTFIVSSYAGLLNTIVSPLTLNGGSGGNYLYVSEANNPSADTLYLTRNTITSGTGSFAPISYTASGGTYHGTAILVAGNGNNVVRVFSAAAGTGYGLYTGNGNSDIIVSSPTSTLDTMAGSLALVAGSGTDLLYVSEAGSTSPDTMSLNSSYVSTTSGLFMTYTATGGNFGAGVFLVTGSANNNVRVLGTAAGSINGIELGDGNNTVVVTSQTGTLDTMAGKIGVQGGTGNNLLYVSDAGSTRPDQLFVSGVAVQSAGFFLSYAASPGGTFGRGVDVVGSNAGTQMYLVGQLAGSPIGLFGGSGNDTFRVYVTTITFYNLMADGQGGSNLLYVYDLSGGVEQVSSVGSSGRITVAYDQGLTSIMSIKNLAVE